MMGALSGHKAWRLLSRLAVLAAVVGGLAAPLVAQTEDAEAEAGDQEEGARADSPANRVTIAIGSMRQTVDGNPLRFRQYVTPPSATHIAELGVVHPLDEAGLTFGVSAYDLLEPSGGGVGYLYEVDQGLRIDSRYRRSEFYRDFYQGANHLRRKDWETDFRWRATRNDYVTGHYSTLSLRGGVIGDAGDNWLSERWGLNYTRSIGTFNASAAYGFEQFGFAGSGPYFAGEASTFRVGFAPGRDAPTLVGGAFSTTTIDLDGLTLSPQETAASVSAFHQLTSDITVTGDLQFWQLEDAVAQNAYAKRERLASIEGEWTGLPRTEIRAGFESAEVSYVNGRQTQVVKPAVNTSLIQLRSRPVRDLKIQADFRRRRVDDRPLAYNIAAQPVTTRIWSDVDRLRVRATYTPSFAPAGITLGYRSDDRENPEQGTSNQVITRDLTAWWGITDDLNASASLMNQSFGLRGVGLATPYVTDSRSWTVGATWQAAGRTSLAANFARSDAFGAAEFRQDTWSVSAEHGWDQHRVRLGLVLDDLDDYNGTLLGYDADLLYAEFSTQLP